jgi:hypothetical protein
MAVAISTRPAHQSFLTPLPLRRPLRAALALASGAGLRLLLASLGMVPVTLIALSTFGLGLRTLAVHVALPAVAVLGVLVARHRAAGALAAWALPAGVVATAIYDASRFGFLWAGVVDYDPIPHIGTALGVEPAGVVGYLWRYLGNGAGLALAFLALGLRGVRVGVAYGLAVCAGLLVTLAVSPHGEELLFALTPGTVVMATVGHAIFGAALGSLAGAKSPAAPRPSPVIRSDRRRAATVDRLHVPRRTSATKPGSSRPARLPACADADTSPEGPMVTRRSHRSGTPKGGRAHDF